jgi:hypothetical protein
VRHEREACPLGEPRACDDRTLDHPGTGKPHSHTVAGHSPNRDGRQGRPRSPRQRAARHCSSGPRLHRVTVGGAARMDAFPAVPCRDGVAPDAPDWGVTVSPRRERALRQRLC